MDTFNEKHCYFITLIICQFFTISSYSNDLRIKERLLSVEDGLSDRNIYHFLECSRGYMWIATSNGLNRFDGQNFKVYKSPAYPLASNSILKIVEDWKGNLWLAHAKHIFGFIFKKQNHKAIGVFNPVLETYQKLEDYLPNLPVSLDSIISIEQFRPKQVHFSTSDGKIYRYDSLGFHLEYKHSSPFDAYPNPTPLADGSYIGFDGKKYLQLRQHAKKYKPNEDKILLDHWRCMRTLRIPLDSLRKHEHLDSLLNHYGFTNYYPNQNTAVLEGWSHDQKKYSHLFYNLKSKEVFNLPFRAQDKNIGDCLHITRQGQVWNIIRPGIVYISELNSYRFRKITHGFPTRGISAADDQSLFISEGHSLSHYTADGKLIAKLPNKQESWATLLDQEALWFSTSHDSQSNLFRYNLKTKQKTEIPTCGSKNTGIYWSIHRDNMERLWAGHESGISYFDPKQGCLQLYKPTPKFKALSSSAVYSFHENAEGIWLATNKGVFLLNHHNKIVNHWNSKHKNPTKRLPFDHILHIYEDRKGIFWLASRGGGLIEWNPNLGTTNQYTTKQGFPNNTLYEVYEDDFGFLWMGSDNGLIRFNKKNHHIEVFTVEDGIAHNEFNTTSHFRGKDGTLYFGGLKGVTQFHPKDFVRDSTPIPQLHITNLQKQDKDGEFHDILSSTLHQNQLTLEPTDLGIQVQFSLMEFLEPKRIVYAYKIEGIDQQWITLDKPSFRINKLDYGNYHLLLRAKTIEGVWTTPLKLPIKVLKPFYLEGYFIAFMIILSVSIFIGISYLRSRAYLKAQESLKRAKKDKRIIQKQAAQLQKIDEVKSRFFSNISHELRTPLTLISSPTHHLLDTLDDISKAEIKQQLELIIRNADTLRVLVDDILDLSKLTDSRMEKEEGAVHLNEYIQLLFTNFNSLAHHLGVNYTLVNDLVKDYWISLDQSKTEKVINNLLSNAFKFTPKGGKVTLHIWETQDILHIQVADTGKGIKAEELPHIFDRFYQGQQEGADFQGSTGIGLALAKEMAMFMGGDLKAESLVGHGSSFTLSLPLKPTDQEHASPLASISSPLPIHPQSYTETLKTKLGTSTAAHHTKGSILIVEDNSLLQEFLTKLLQQDYFIFNAYNGYEALELLKLERIQLIISDVMMPELDGFSFLEKLRQEHQWRGIPVIMLTALGNDKHRLKALNLGVDDYLTKPFTPQELFARVHNLITRFWEKEEWALSRTEETNQTTTTTSNGMQPSSIENSILAEDLDWIEEVKQIILKELSNKYFLLEDVADNVNLSMRQFRRKVKKITGMSPSELHREVALQEARKLLENHEYTTIKAVAQSVGFAQNTARFSKYYFSRFGKKPVEYLKELG